MTMTVAQTDAGANPAPLPPVDRFTPAALLAHGRGARPAVLPAESVDALVARRTRANPGATAFEDDSSLVTYEALEHAACCIAAALAARGLTRCSRVAVCMSRGSDLLATLLGVLKVGAAYVPIDVSCPPARVRLLLVDAQPHLLVTDSLTHDRLVREFAGLAVLKDELQDDLAPATFSASTPEDVAYIMYTSGSTGRPKGVGVTHRAILSRIIHTDYVSVAADDRMAFASNVSFDAATFEIWGALVNGAALVPIDPTDLVVPARLGTRIRERHITMLVVTPAVFNTDASEMPTAFAPLRVLMFGGEAANPSAVRRVLTAGPPETLMNVYGPTECTTFATSYRIRELSDCADTIPIGRPIAYTDAYVMDSSGAPAPYGSPGELYLGGEGLAEGYHGNPALTAERFVIGPCELGRLYRTGDRCRWRTDGNLEFMGRLDRQIKLRGHRIEPAEIEAALLSHACVANAVVDAPGESAEDKRLVAYIARMDGCALDLAALRRDLQRRLPSYMIPAEFVIAERLPLTPNGKIDRTLLQDVVVVAPQERRIAAPRDPLEEDLVRIWQEVLAETAISIHDDFFDLGGHSLAAAAMVAKASATFDREVPLSLLLENPTLAGFADALVGATRTTAAAVVAVRKDGSRPPLFFLHGDINGGGLYCARLARGIQDQPVYALAPFGCDGGGAPASIEAMAARHASAIREVWPRGPYLLGGHCNGALEALEIARLFRREGHEVPAVVLIQPTPIDPVQVLVQRLFSIASPLLRHNDEQRVDAALRLAERIRKIAAHPAASLKKGPKLIRAWLAGSERQASVRRTSEGCSTPVRHIQAVWDLYERAVAVYVPRRYDGPAAIFLAEDVVNTADDPSEGWRKVGKRFEFHIVRGGHLSCITTHVTSTALAIDWYLEAALRA